MSFAWVLNGLESACTIFFFSPSCCSRGKPAKHVKVALGFVVALCFYLATFVLMVLATGVLRESNGILVQHMGLVKMCESKTGRTFEQCAGELALRVSFGSFIFHALHSLLCFRMTREDDPRVDIYTGFFFWKLLIWIGNHIGFLYIPASVSRESAFDWNGCTCDMSTCVHTCIQCVDQASDAINLYYVLCLQIG